MINHNGKRLVLHTSDLHLLSPGDRACEGLEAVVDLALKVKVDLVLIAGDFFDHNRVEPKLVSFVVEQLRRLAVPTVVLPGNHDCLVPDSVYRRPELVNLWDSVPNVHIMKSSEGETLPFADIGITVWGKAIVDYENDLKPLGDIPLHDSNGQWHIAIAHGYYSGTEYQNYRQYNITMADILASHQDYIALGHWPTFRCLCSEPTKAYYCDSPSLGGTVNIIEFSHASGVEVIRVPLDMTEITYQV
jgi:DNA repair exonuclease SbcCD nuclease subunit